MNLWDSDWSIMIPGLIAGHGVLVGIGGAGWYAFKKRRLSGWTRTNGRVESYESVPDEGGFYYNPIVVFSDSSGRPVRFRVAARWNRQLYEIGGPIPVRFSPKNAQRAVIDRWAESYGEVIMLYVLSGFLIISGAGLACFFAQ
jgi:hypothetical protein